MTAVDEQALLATARAAAEHAYAPYSGFAVGAALLTAAGQVVTGANVENAAYPVGLCAERVAMAAAVAAGVREFRALAVVSGEEPCPPCGMCRQFLFEFAPGLLVLSGGPGGPIRRWTLSEDLLPEAFGPERLSPA